ncbi:MAG: hypothetical protein ABSG37_08745 [Candidatus Limnocylindrales bacterium]
MTAELQRGGRLARELRTRRGHDFERCAVDRRAHHSGIERTHWIRLEVTGQLLHERSRAIHVGAAAAPRPQQELEVPFDEPRAGSRIRAVLESPALVVAHCPARLLQGEPDGAP